MPSNAFSPSKLDVVNLALGELGRLPVDSIESDESAKLIALRLDVLLPELLLKCPLDWTIKFKTDNTPITQPFTTEFTYSFQLPADYGRIFRFYQMYSNYMMVDGMLCTNQNPISYYYIVNNVDYDIMPPLFEHCLALFAASKVCVALTNSVELAINLYKEYEMKLYDLVLQNDMERRIVTAPNNDYDRFVYI